jgi:site-specific DNA-methyltransferase (adenine-specific)
MTELLDTGPTQGDALEFLYLLPGGSAKICFFDPQFRTNLARLDYGNEGKNRQIARCALPQMTDHCIEQCAYQIARALQPGGYCFMWCDAVRLCEGSHQRFVDALHVVDLLSWDDQHFGMGCRLRRQGGYLLVLQTAPVRAKGTWNDHSIPDRWSEKVNWKITHRKPIGLIKRLIAATTSPGDLVIDPCAGVTFPVMQAAHELGRRFAGVDIAYSEIIEERKASCLG